MISFINIEAVNRSKQSDVSFADQIRKIKTMVLVFLRYIYNKAEICIYDFIFCGFIAVFSFQSKFGFFFTGKKRDFVDVFEIHCKNVFVVCHLNTPYVLYIASSMPTLMKRRKLLIFFTILRLTD